ncbi:hypothetical protein RSAG8_05893, partial [Rhizoctonia solani AG-8 WAC10335]
MCGCETGNEILSQFAVRLCDDCSAEHITETWSYRQWQNGPYATPEKVFLPDLGRTLPTPCQAQVFAPTAAQHVPTDADYYSMSQPPLGEWGVVADGTIATTGFYGDTYLNPTFTSPAHIDAYFGFPTDEDEDKEVFQGTQPFGDDLTNHHGSPWLPPV